MSAGCVIVGASHAGTQVALSLAKLGWQKGITLIGDEPHLPYHRPPLSKDFLLGGKTLAQLQLRPREHFDRAGVTLRLGERVESIDCERNCVRLADGSELDYEILVLATGARVRELPGAPEDLAGVHYLRNAEDVGRIQQSLNKATDAVIVGGGYIGLEAAASLRKRGLAVSIVEMSERVLQRVTTPVLSDFFTRLHRQNGVDVRTGIGTREFGGGAALAHVTLADGERVDAQLAIIGIGVVPNADLAEAAGIAVSNGVDVDSHGRTSVDNVYACGDCANGLNLRYADRQRLESVQNANDQGLCVARAICGQATDYNAVPWFWSDQFDVKLQIAGLSGGHDRTVIRGNPESGRSFAVFYLRGDELLAVDAINRPKEFAGTRALLATNARVAPERLAAEDVALKDCAV